MHRAWPTVALAAGVAFLVGACTGPPAGDPTGSPTAAATTGAPSAEPTSQPSPGPTASSPGPTAAPSPSPSGPHGRLALTGWEQHHPNPTSVALEVVEIDPAGNLLVDIEAVNSSRGHARLALTEVLAVDDLGNTYPFVRPDDSREAYELGFDPDRQLSGTLAFVGPVDPDATTLDIGFNQDGQDQMVSAVDDSISQYPKFAFTGVPLPGVGLDDRAARAGDDLTERPTVEMDRTVEPENWPGVAVTVERVTADDRTVTIDLEIVNQYDRTMEFLNRTPVLFDGHDTNFIYVEDATGNLEQRIVKLTPGDEATVTLSWRGSIHPDAESLTLALNNLDRGSEPDVTRSPYIRIGDLPVPRPDDD